MYAGSIVEEGPTTMLLEKMAHPYTRGLLAAMPQRVLQHDQPARRRPRLKTIPGTVPDPLQPITGCAFAGRCRFVQSNCRDATPGLAALSADHRVACFHPVTTETALEVIN
ncbi:MAG: oligopeptide/dipeptide ABC transporter ATP-binding protein [Geminicoccaceae bacterium]